MERSLSLSLLTALTSQQTSEIVVALVTLSHNDWSQPIRITSDYPQTISNGNTFVHYPFDLTLPNIDNRTPEMKLVISNVSRDIIAQIRALSSPITVTVQIVLASAPNFPQATFPNFKIRVIDYDTMQISGSMSRNTTKSEPYPSERMTRTSHPGLHA